MDKLLHRALGQSTEQMVREFHDVYLHPKPEVPVLPSKEVMQLRLQMIQSEVDEFEDAINSNDFIGAIDALGDIEYLTHGGFEVFGVIEANRHEVMARIQASNMSKYCESVEEAEAFIDATTNEDGPIYYYEVRRPNQVILYHALGKKKGKVAKGPKYKAPDLSFLEKARINK